MFSFPQNLYVETLCPSVMVLGTGALDEVMGTKPFGMSALIRVLFLESEVWLTLNFFVIVSYNMMEGSLSFFSLKQPGCFLAITGWGKIAYPQNEVFSTTKSQEGLLEFSFYNVLDNENFLWSICRKISYQFVPLTVS